ncbi:MAG: CocE/NonD family hydrolase [Gemmatimonadaceae bacterium]
MTGTPRRVFQIGGAFSVLWCAVALGLAVRAGAQQTDTLIFARDVKIKMHLGPALHARVYRPSGKALRPAIFSLEADTSEARDRGARALVAAGYAVVIAAPRGGDDKHVGRDGYDAVEWINDQSWSDRQIVMAGTGAGADAAWNAARERPPHLDAILARTPTRLLAWSPKDLERTAVSALSIAGSAGAPQGTAIENDSIYVTAAHPGGPPAAYLVIGTLAETQLADLEREWFGWAVGRGQLPALVRKRVNYLVANDSTWRAAASFAGIGAVPTSFPLHTNAGPRNAPGGFLGDEARDNEPADTLPAGGKEYKSLLGAPLDVAGRPSVTLWLDHVPEAGLEVRVDEVRADGATISLGQSGGRLVPPDTAAPKIAQREWVFDAFAWEARRLEAGSSLRLVVRGEGGVVYHDVDRYSRVILPVVRGQR